MAALATSVPPSYHDSAIALSGSPPHGRINVPAYKGQMQVPSAALFKNTVSPASIRKQVHLNHVSLRGRELTSVRCSNREDATSAGEDSMEGLDLLEQSLRKRSGGEQRDAADQAAQAPVDEDKKADTHPGYYSKEISTEIVTSLDPTTVESAAPDADVSKPAGVSSTAQDWGDRWRAVVSKLRIPLPIRVFGPDRERLSTEEDKAILMELGTTAHEKALHWGDSKKRLLLDDVIRGSGFSPLDEGGIGKASISFVGFVETEPAEILRNLEEKLKQNSPDLTAILVGYRPEDQVAGVLFAPRKSLVTLTLPEPLLFLTSIGSLLYCLLCSSLSTPDIDLPLHPRLSITPTALFITFASSLAAVTTVAARYGILHLLEPPFYLPSAVFGTFGVVTSYKGLLPGKIPAFDLALATSLAPLLTSSAIITAGILAGNATPIGEVSADYIFVPETVLGHSGPLTQLASSLAAVVILPEAIPADISMGVDVALSAFQFSNRVPMLAVDPLVFGGLVALHASSMTLLPISKLSGGMIAHSLFGSTIADPVSKAFIVGVGLKLALNNVMDGVLWTMYMLPWVSKDEGGGKPLRDNSTRLGVGRATLGCGLVAAACAILLF